MNDERRDFFYILMLAVVVLIAAVIYKCYSTTAAYSNRGLLDTNKKEVVYGEVY